MATMTIKEDLKMITAHLLASASYEDAMYALYVRMKSAQGRRAADKGRVLPHKEAHRRFMKSRGLIWTILKKNKHPPL
jgi:hypothetical protein